MNANLNILESAQRYEHTWAKPDLSILNSYRTDPPKLPIDVFGPLAGWISNAAEIKSAPMDYVAGMLLSVSAGIIGNTLSVSPWEGWTEPSVLWLANVGLPSSNKSPAADAILDPVSELEAEMQRDYATRIQDYETDLERAKVERENWEKDLREAVKRNEPQPPKPEKAFEPEPPASPRLRVLDSTAEALAMISLDNPRGIISIQDELSGWLENQNRYSGNGSDRPFWLQAFGARSYIVDRVKNRGRQKLIPRLSVSVVGGIQPDLLDKALLNGADDGLSGRFLFIWPNPVPPNRPKSKEDTATISRVIRRLYSIKMTCNENGEPKPKTLLLDSDAADIFQLFRQGLAELEHAAYGPLLSHVGKLPGITLRLALVLEMLWWAMSSECNPPASVSLKATSAACSLVEDYFLPMAWRVFGSASLPDSDKHAAMLAKWIYKSRPEKVNASHIRRHREGGLKTTEAVAGALVELVDAAWLIPAPSREGASSGRQKQDYLVNPKIWEETQE